MSKPLIAELVGRRQKRVPFWLMRQAGRYLPEYQRLRAESPDFLKFCYSPALTIEAALQPLQRFRPDAAILFSDILVIPDALGCSVRFVEGSGPLLEPVRSEDAIPRCEPGRLEERLGPVFASVEGLRPRLPADVALIGFAGAPWTVAVYMVEGRGGTECQTVRSWAYGDPDGFGKLIDTLVEATTWYLRRQVQSGAEVIQVFDSWAGRLSEPEFRRWVIQPTARICAALKAEWPELPIIGFPRGAGALYRAYAVETGVDAVSLDAGVPLAWAATTLQIGCTLQGNLDNLLLRIGTPALPNEVERILQTLGSGPFVFNLGHGILPETPVEHVAALAEQIRAWRRGGT